MHFMLPTALLLSRGEVNCRHSWYPHRSTHCRFYPPKIGQMPPDERQALDDPFLDRAHRDVIESAPSSSLSPRARRRAMIEDADDDGESESEGHDSPAQFLGGIFLGMPPVSPTGSSQLQGVPAHLHGGTLSTPQRPTTRTTTIASPPTTPSAVYDNIFLETDAAIGSQVKRRIPKTPYPPRRRRRSCQSKTVEPGQEETSRAKVRYSLETIASRLKTAFYKAIKKPRNKIVTKPAWRPW
ncbi:hypothetical protein NEOLEDRAFT_563187 [Neolentinus lepideus HHB14362 ss-1]|uniref:Uncharacterized protein n=1 Tax=Neolentinus lepideus HHB14362 ss-1 TaxID=1314782 RepID=A0A165R2M1_9AGAM|nr:hypothetical protein NEOLEDRAFT_563187 [Neolentinus lepideus HHB14362 ss-1]